MATTLAAALQAARLATKLTQTQLARLVGVHVNAIARWENGRGRPTKRLRPVLIQTFATLRPELGHRVAAALAKAFPPKPRWGRIQPPPPQAEEEADETPSYPAKTWVDSGVFRLADHLDVSPRRAREGAAKFLRLLGDGGVTVEAALAELRGALGEDDELDAEAEG